MRRHLAGCLEDGVISHFPAKKRAVRKMTKRTEEMNIYCICRMPEEGGDKMISCDNCQQWFHGQCVTVPPQAWTDKDFVWKCSDCMWIILDTLYACIHTDFYYSLYFCYLWVVYKKIVVFSLVWHCIAVTISLLCCFFILVNRVMGVPIFNGGSPISRWLWGSRNPIFPWYWGPPSPLYRYNGDPGSPFWGVPILPWHRVSISPNPPLRERPYF